MFLKNVKCEHYQLTYNCYGGGGGVAVGNSSAQRN